MNKTTAEQSLSTVSVTRCDGYGLEALSDAIQRHFTYHGGIEKIISPGDHVLLKPNLIAPRPADAAATTHPAVILTVARLLKDYGAKPFIGDSPAWGDLAGCIDALGLTEPLKKLGVPIKPFTDSKRLKIASAKPSISTCALEADKIINLPKLKAHTQVAATIAIKNMYGCVCGKQKAYWHLVRGKDPEEFCQMLIALYQKLAPAITIIDGVVAMEGVGPVRGTPRSMNCIVAGFDPIACERVCCKLINIDPNSLPIVKTAEKLGYGPVDIRQIEILGDDIEGLICEDFCHPDQIPLRFSFLQICKSLIRQFFILVKGKKI